MTMKKLGIVLLAMIFVSCSAGSIQLRKPVSPVCDKLTDSWICEKSREMGIEPENIYGWVFSAAAIAGIQKTSNITFICNFEQEIADWYAENRPLSYDSLIDEALIRSDLIKDPVKLILAKRILNENIVYYRSPNLIKDDDDWLITQGHNKFRKDLMCEQVAAFK